MLKDMIDSRILRLVLVYHRAYFLRDVMKLGCLSMYRGAVVS